MRLSRTLFLPGVTMFGFLKRLFVAARVEAPRAVFAFRDGTRERSVDPVLAWQRLESAVGAEWPEQLKILAAPDPAVGPAAAKVLAGWRQTQEQAARRLADAACEAFGVEPHTDEGGVVRGLTLAERVALCAAFLEFMGGLAHAARFTRGSLPATA